MSKKRDTTSAVAWIQNLTRMLIDQYEVRAALAEAEKRHLDAEGWQLKSLLVSRLSDVEIAKLKEPQ